jgi:hypothetical protein
MLSQLYVMFGFLFIVLLILVVTCAEISIVMVYFQLCNEDYRWWWRLVIVYGILDDISKLNDAFFAGHTLRRDSLECTCSYMQFGISSRSCTSILLWEQVSFIHNFICRN